MMHDASPDDIVFIFFLKEQKIDLDAVEWEVK